VFFLWVGQSTNWPIDSPPSSPDLHDLHIACLNTYYNMKAILPHYDYHWPIIGLGDGDSDLHRHDWQMNTIDGQTKLVRQDTILGGLSIGQLKMPTKYFFTVDLVILCIIWNLQIQVFKNNVHPRQITKFCANEFKRFHSILRGMIKCHGSTTVEVLRYHNDKNNILLTTLKT